MIELNMRNLLYAVPLIAVAVSVLAQALAAARSRAEQLARTGHNAESLALFERIAAGNPDDTEARLWVARLQLRVGRTKEAEAGFRAVVKEHPADVDARIGLGMALTRAGEWQEALDVLRRAARDARDDNSELHGGLAFRSLCVHIRARSQYHICGCKKLRRTRCPGVSMPSGGGSCARMRRSCES